MSCSVSTYGISAKRINRSIASLFLSLSLSLSFRLCNLQLISPFFIDELLFGYCTQQRRLDFNYSYYLCQTFYPFRFFFVSWSRESLLIKKDLVVSKIVEDVGWTRWSPRFTKLIQLAWQTYELECLIYKISCYNESVINYSVVIFILFNIFCSRYL